MEAGGMLLEEGQQDKQDCSQEERQDLVGRLEEEDLIQVKAHIHLTHCMLQTPKLLSNYRHT